MKHVFIINPNAGKKSKLEHFTNEIKTTAEALGVEYELYFTKGPKDCGKYARSFARRIAPEAKK